MDNLNNQNMVHTESVFSKHFLNNQSLYLYCFKRLPNRHFINSIDGEKAYKAFKEAFGHLVQQEYQYRWFHGKRKKYQFADTLFVLHNNCIVELKDYCEILHDGSQALFINSCTELMNKFREKGKRQPLEINVVVSSSYGLELKPMEIKRSRLNLDLFYEDDFAPVDAVIQKRLNRKDDKGIVLLHGLPGTGKTTYLRYLIGKVKKKVLFLSPAVAGNLMNPEFIDLLIDNPNTILVIEDAENILMDRKISSSGSVSNLLNISDGLLADFLNVQLVCTFNSALTLVDEALVRKGRLIARYEFGKLGIEKAQRLSQHLGYETIIKKPMTVAEITNQNEKEFGTKTVEVLGFRQAWPTN